MVNALQLFMEIEKERELMLSLSNRYALTSKEVIASSQRLDHLISIYQRLQAKSNSKIS
ncbi:MAG TPA: aspartyl-phosphate phosphatase Spo0E family protein [Candidatus Avamphibacillus intestinigallinarum]|nr:aspartyl-phosphate phosphatase Spo0E family protein [Candidatus Avamphibacillus intestinigallinarum]